MPKWGKNGLSPYSPKGLGVALKKRKIVSREQKIGISEQEFMMHVVFFMKTCYNLQKIKGVNLWLGDVWGFLFLKKLQKCLKNRFE